MVKPVDHRRTARTVALQSLFAADIRDIRTPPSFDWLDEEIAQNALEFANGLVRGVFSHCAGLDGLIGRFAPAWPVSQLSLIDRNILRIALYELLHHAATPKKTAINEAVELAKVFGSDSSARFVNGVLGSVMADLESGELTTTVPMPEGR